MIFVIIFLKTKIELKGTISVHIFQIIKLSVALHVKEINTPNLLNADCNSHFFVILSNKIGGKTSKCYFF